MPQIINLDAIECDYIDIIKAGETYHLRDDVPSETLLQVLALDRAAYIDGIDTTVPANEADVTLAEVHGRAQQMELALRRYKADVVHILGEIFRHTLPQTTDAELLARFSLAEAEQVVQLFFLRAGPASRVQPGGSAGSTPTTSTDPAKRRRRRH